MLATALLTKQLVGPGTFQAGLELYEVAGPAGLYLMKLKLGHWWRMAKNFIGLYKENIFMNNDI